MYASVESVALIVSNSFNFFDVLLPSSVVDECIVTESTAELNTCTVVTVSLATIASPPPVATSVETILHLKET